MRKLLKKLLLLLFTIFILFTVFVLVCAFNPDFTEKVADFLYSKDRNLSQVNNADTVGQSETGSMDAMGRDMVNAEEMINRNQSEDLILPDIQAGGILESGQQNDPGSDQMEYVKPEQSDISVPDKVSGRNGYEPIQEDRRQIEEEEAKELIQQLGTGNTGDDLTFNVAFYPYYNMLDEKGKHLYRQIYANANDLNQAFAPVEEIQVEELKDIFAAVYNDHPELFFMETAYYCKYRRNGQCVEIELSFNRTAQNLEGARAELNGKAGEIIAGAQGLADDYSKEKYVHDALVEEITYNKAAEMGQSAYSALVNGQTVCAGYARAFQYIMQQLGIPCYYCTGYAGENHAWNVIALDDGYYNVDVTWDDTEESTYDYFNKTDSDYADSHIRRDLSVKLPPCNGQKYRNLEQNAGNKDKRSLQETGISQEKVFAALSEYENDCYDRILQLGTGEYSFENVIAGREILEEWYHTYQSGTYKQDYLESAMREVGASDCRMKLSVEELQDDQYLIIHEISLK